MFERFTDRARQVMQLANQQAGDHKHESISTEAVLLGLLLEGSGVGMKALLNLRINVKKLRAEVESRITIRETPDSPHQYRLPQEPEVTRVIEYAMEEARSLKHNYVGTEHILLGLLRVRDSVARDILEKFNLKESELRNVISKILGTPLYFERNNLCGKQIAKQIARSSAISLMVPVVVLTILAILVTLALWNW